MVVAEGGAIIYWVCSAKDRYTLIEQSSNYRITCSCMQYSQKNFMRIIGNEQKNIYWANFWEILERIIIGKISSIIGAGLATISLSMR